MNESLTCGEAIVDLLSQYGVDTVFGIPGTHTVELYRGLIGKPVRHVLARHEQGAGFMAEGYARNSGKPGVCFLITGPGVLNAATPIASAFNDSIALLVISSAVNLAARGKGWGEGHEMRDQRALTSSITAFSATAYRPDDLPDLIARAFAVFSSARPRPVHIEIPTDVLAQRLDAQHVSTRWTKRVGSARPCPTPEGISAAAEVMDRAQNPLIYVGGGARDAVDELAALAEKTASPVINTVGGIGILPGHHPLSLGAAMSFEEVRQWVSESDALLAVGTEMGHIDQWYATLEAPKNLIRVDIDVDKLADHYPPRVALHADAKTTLGALVRACESASPSQLDAAKQRVVVMREQMFESLSELEHKHVRVLETIKKACPTTVRLFGDMTQLAYTTCRYVPFDSPGQFVHPLGFGCLGYALPAGLGAKIARKSDPVVIITGDSGLLYTAQEMATAIDEKAPLVLIVWNNHGLGEIRNAFSTRGIQAVAVNPTPANHQALAQAFGWQMSRAASHPELLAQIENALATNTSTLIELNESDPY